MGPQHDLAEFRVKSKTPAEYSAPGIKSKGLSFCLAPSASAHCPESSSHPEFVWFSNKAMLSLTSRVLPSLACLPRALPIPRGSLLT